MDFQEFGISEFMNVIAEQAMEISVLKGALREAMERSDYWQTIATELTGQEVTGASVIINFGGNE